MQVVKCAPFGVSTTPLDHHPAEQQPLDRGVDGEAGGVDDLLARDVGPVGGHAEQVVEVGVRAEVRRVAVLVGAVEVDQRDVEARGRVRRPAPRRRRTGW